MLFGNGAVRFLHGLNAKYRAVGKHIYFMAPEFAQNARGTYKKAAVVMTHARRRTVATPTRRRSPSTWAWARCASLFPLGIRWRIFL